VLRQLSALVPVSISHFQARPPGCRASRLPRQKDHLLCLTDTFNSQVPRRNPIQKSRRQAGCAVNVLRHLRFAPSTFCGKSTAFRRDLVLCQQTSILIRALSPEQYAFEVSSRLELKRGKTPTWSPSLIRTHRLEENTTQEKFFRFRGGSQRNNFEIPNDMPMSREPPKKRYCTSACAERTVSCLLIPRYRAN